MGRNREGPVQLRQEDHNVVGFIYRFIDPKVCGGVPLAVRKGWRPIV